MLGSGVQVKSDQTIKRNRVDEADIPVIPPLQYSTVLSPGEERGNYDSDADAASQSDAASFVFYSSLDVTHSHISLARRALPVYLRSMIYPLLGHSLHIPPNISRKMKSTSGFTPKF